MCTLVFCSLCRVKHDAAKFCPTNTMRFPTINVAPQMFQKWIMLAWEIRFPWIPNGVSMFFFVFSGVFHSFLHRPPGFPLDFEAFLWFLLVFPWFSMFFHGFIKVSPSVQGTIPTVFHVAGRLLQVLAAQHEIPQQLAVAAVAAFLDKLGPKQRGTTGS